MLEAARSGRDQSLRTAYEKYLRHETAIAHIRQEWRDGEAAYMAGPWPRAYLVISDDGHVHRSRTCPTCRPQTRFEWLTQYSGATEEEIVRDAGWLACTVCYPSAPAAVRNREPRLVSRERSDREAARLARAEARAEAQLAARAKAPTANGEPLVLSADETGLFTETLKTERSARAQWNHLQDWIVLEHPDANAMRRGQQRIEEALAGKHQCSPSAMREELQQRWASRRRNR